MALEKKTVESIHAEMLSGISNDYEKSVGFPTFDFTKSFSIEANKIYSLLYSLMDLVDVDKLTGDELTKYVWQRKGIKRKLATNAKGTVTVTGNGAISINNLFSTTNGIQFKSLENKNIVGSGDIKIQAVIAGNIGNVGANTITQMPVTLQGITSCINNLATYDGYEEESDDSLRARYYEALQLPATSGNIAHYKIWAKECTGVGGVKVIPLWNGANTVKVLIIDSNKQLPSTDLITQAQNYIDPKGTNNSTWGTGAGQAPIGAYCTVTGPLAKNIAIQVKLVLQDNYTVAEVKKNIQNNINSYLKEITFLDKDFDISYARVGSIIFNTAGVKDYTNLLVNGLVTNTLIGIEEIPVLTDVQVVI